MHSDSLPLLNRSWLRAQARCPSDLTVGTLADWPERVLQFGEGNFLRAFVDWHLQRLREAGEFQGSVVVVQPLARGTVDTLNNQEGLYTLWMRGLNHGQPAEQLELITCVRRGLNPYRDWPAFLACAENPHLRYVVSNTTEAGIAYQSTPEPRDQCPDSFPAKVAALIQRRYHRFGGSADKGLVFLPCELIENNGGALKECVTRHLEAWGADPGLMAWLESAHVFCTTLVDRIVPGPPRGELPSLTARLGYHDDLLVTSELFHQWVIQGPRELQDELPFTRAGLNVIWTDDVRPYRTLKVRILNGTHTLFTLPAFLGGRDTVRQGLEDPVLGEFIRRGLNDEILPTLDFDEPTKQRYADAVLERFRNPFIHHPLLSIALNSVSKFKVRVLPSIRRYIELRRTAPPMLAFSLAALIEFYRDAQTSDKGWFGQRMGEPYPIQDDPSVLGFFQARRGWSASEPERLCREVLAESAFWDADLGPVPGLQECVTRSTLDIRRDGMVEALRKRLQS